MALIECMECGKQVSDKSPACIGCGAPMSNGDQVALVSRPVPYVVKTAKSRGVYIILGLLFGTLGIHNFYAGYYGRGVAQLLITLLLGWAIIGLAVTFIWALIEIIVEARDGSGDLMV
ncbi:TM2 domain-containing protein [Stenotrophomonas sp.]|uniref:TM2 domain-containing protein n=1 Tax=Stenotrophomonas sp. TaxID=69392 RepID=UPI0019A2DE93|nr:TM2 domain-containing protein [Stenotrophomonas sp.]MBD3825645.1 TM2 domain-containing protein [Stenotrophomonas sp.]